MTTWKDGGNYGRLSREIVNEDSSHAICTVWTRQNAEHRGVDIRHADTEPWPEGEANFRLILKAPQMLEALRTIAEGAIVSSDQAPEKITEQVLRVLRIAREAAAEYMVWVGMQQKRAERAEAALEAIVALKPPRWGSSGDYIDAYDQCKAFAVAAIAAAKEAPAKDEN